MAQLLLWLVLVVAALVVEEVVLGGARRAWAWFKQRRRKGRADSAAELNQEILQAQLYPMNQVVRGTRISLKNGVVRDLVKHVRFEESVWKGQSGWDTTWWKDTEEMVDDLLREAVELPQSEYQEQARPIELAARRVKEALRAWEDAKQEARELPGLPQNRLAEEFGNIKRDHVPLVLAASWDLMEAVRAFDAHLLANSS